MGVFSQSIGTIIFAVNKVTAQQGSKERTLTRGSPVYVGETIVTGPDSRAQLKYLNGTLIDIQPNTHYQTVAYQPKDLKSNLSIGAIQYTSTGKKKGTIQTPVVALAILGTQFQLIATPTMTYINIIQGYISVNGVVYGPGEQYSSGSFDQNGNFTPGTIPWASTNGNFTTGTIPWTSADATTYDFDFDVDGTNTTMEITEIIPMDIIDNSVNAILAAFEVEIAGLTLIYPPII